LLAELPILKHDHGMKRLPFLLVALVVCGCDRQKPLTDAEKAAELSKDRSDIAEKIASGRNAEARDQYIKEMGEKATKESK
jgi:hypothetical protein